MGVGPHLAASGHAGQHQLGEHRGRERAMEEARSIYAEALTLDDCADSESSSRWK
jgi:hypothetical protein